MKHVEAHFAHSDSDHRWSQLMAATQRGDEHAYRCLLREIVPFIRAIAAYHHEHRDRIDEVLQDTLLTIHRVRHTFDPSRSFRRWLAAIARRRSVDALRRRYRHATFEVSAETIGLAYESYADPVATLRDDTPPRSGLREAIRSLPATQREAIELLRLGEMSLSEASTMTGRSIAALKVNAHRAIRSLQKQLQTG